MASSNRTYKYAVPDPFVMPQVFFTATLPAIGVPRETLFYSSIIIEDIMKNINDEYEARGKTKPTWKAYNAGTDDFSAFTPDPKNGGNLSKVPIKFFPAIVKDIQVAIEALLNDTAYPDDKKSYFARIFGDGTIHIAKGTWSKINRIKDGYIVPATNAAGKQVLNPLANILAGLWPFPVDPNNYRGEGHVENPLARMGVDIHGIQYIKNEKSALETSAPDFPASVIGKKRTEQNVAIKDGQLIPKQGSSIEGIDGIDIPMRPEGRPESNRINKENTSTGFGKNVFDPDAGYTYLAHHPLVIQQLRWQPPIIEKFDGPDKIPEANYTQQIYSNTTLNLGFIFANPSEKLWFMNFGQWLVKGKAKSDSTGLTLIAAPDQFNGFLTTVCPFSVFYPPPTVDCSCNASDTSYAVWGAGGLGENLIWDGINIFQSDNPQTLVKRIGAKTRIRVKNTYNPSVGSPNPKHYYAIAIRINSIGGVNLQPFIPIYVDGGSDPESSLTSYLDVMSIPKQVHSDGSFSINIIDAIKKSYPQYNQTQDFILAMAVFVHQSVSGRITCPVIDVFGGSIIQPGCREGLNCSMGTITSKTSYIQIYEPPFDNANDIRLP